MAEESVEGEDIPGSGLGKMVRLVGYLVEGTLRVRLGEKN